MPNTTVRTHGDICSQITACNCASCRINRHHLRNNREYRESVVPFLAPALHSHGIRSTDRGGEMDTFSEGGEVYLFVLYLFTPQHHLFTIKCRQNYSTFCTWCMVPSSKKQ